MMAEDVIDITWTSVPSMVRYRTMHWAAKASYKASKIRGTHVTPFCSLAVASNYAINQIGNSNTGNHVHVTYAEPPFDMPFLAKT